MTDSYKILYKKITDLQLELQKSTAKEKKGTILTEVGENELCWQNSAHRKIEGGD